MIKGGFLSGATLKLLACVFMVFDHMGMELFPEQEWMRYVGRLAFPLFAFFIAEGCHYTKSRPKRLLTVFVLGVICEAVYIVAMGEYYGNILLTFSASIVLIYNLQEIKTHLLGGHSGKAVAFGGLLILLLCGIWLFVQRFGIDYGFAGVLTAVLVSLPDGLEDRFPLFKRGGLPVKLILLVMALAFVVPQSSVPVRQLTAFAAVPLLALYNGKPGKHRFKYGFYLFYPLHLVMIELLAILILPT